MYMEEILKKKPHKFRPNAMFRSSEFVITFDSSDKFRSNEVNFKSFNYTYTPDIMSYYSGNFIGRQKVCSTFFDTL